MEMNYLEVDFLFCMGFELNVAPDIFHSYCSILQREMYLLESPPAPPRLHCCLTEEDQDPAEAAGCRRGALVHRLVENTH